MASPNFTLEKMRLTVRKQQIELNKQTVILRITELQDEIRRLNENIPSYDKEMDGIVQQVANLSKAESDKAEAEKAELEKANLESTEENTESFSLNHTG